SELGAGAECGTSRASRREIWKDPGLDGGAYMATIDQTLTWRKAEARLATETDPVLRRNLEMLLQHMKAAATLDMEALMPTAAQRKVDPDDIVLYRPETSVL